MELSRYFADFAEHLGGLRSIDEVMTAIVITAVEAVDGCEHASLSYTAGRELRSAASNDEVGPALDAAQTELQEGPCLDAIRTGDTMVSPDLVADGRWPAYGPRAAGIGVRSSLAVPLRRADRTIGALNLFAGPVGTFDHDDGAEQVALATVVAAHSAPALAAALLQEDMQRALESRDVIGQAKGYLMARTGVGEEEAFAVLVRASQRLNVKLVEVARRLVAGRLDSPG